MVEVGGGGSGSLAFSLIQKSSGANISRISLSLKPTDQPNQLEEKKEACLWIGKGVCWKNLLETVGENWVRKSVVDLLHNKFLFFSFVAIARTKKQSQLENETNLNAPWKKLPDQYSFISLFSFVENKKDLTDFPIILFLPEMFFSHAGILN